MERNIVQVQYGVVYLWKFEENKNGAKSWASEMIQHELKWSELEAIC